MEQKELGLFESRMTVKEVAKVLGVSERLVQKRMNELFPNISRKGVTTRLTETEVTAIKLRIQENSSLATSHDRARLVNMPKTDIEKELLIQQAMQFQAEKIQTMQQELLLANNQLELQAPKVDFYNQVTESTETIPMGQVAKVLNIKNLGRNKLFRILKDLKILQENRDPYQEYINRGYFRIIEQKYTKPNGRLGISFKTIVYQKGLDYILKRVKEVING